MGKIIHASKIDLSNQGLTEIPSYIFDCKNLKILKLNNNAISEIPKELSHLKQLRNLDISNNNISQLYARTFDLQNLVTLNLNNNQIKTVPKQIGTLVKLQKLLLAGNLIERLPEEIKNLSSLKALNISSNQFVHFPESILTLSGINYLWIGQNQLQKIPTDEIINCWAELKAIYCYKATVEVENKAMNLLTTQRGNCINTLKLMGYNESNSMQKSKTKSDDRHLPPKIFISYSHKDEKYKDEVVTTLNALRNVLPQLTFEYWVDTKIKTGEDWRKEIEAALDSSGVAILVISREFLASDFIMNTEVPTILENAETKGVTILSLIAGHCIFKKSALGRFQSVNEPSKPLKSLSDHEQDVVYTKLSDKVEHYLTL